MTEPAPVFLINQLLTQQIPITELNMEREGKRETLFWDSIVELRFWQFGSAVVKNGETNFQPI